MDLTAERERWAEVEAQHFEKSADYLEELRAGWLSKGPSLEGYQKCAEITIRAQAWRDAATRLRQPKHIRLEMEQRQ